MQPHALCIIHCKCLIAYKYNFHVYKFFHFLYTYTQCTKLNSEQSEVIGCIHFSYKVCAPGKQQTV